MIPEPLGALPIVDHVPAAHEASPAEAQDHELRAHLVSVIPSIKLLLTPDTDGGFHVSVPSPKLAPFKRPRVPHTGPTPDRSPTDPVGRQAGTVEAGDAAVAYSLVIVDDVKGMRRLVSILLEESGRFDVVGEAATGLEGIEVVREAEPDLVLLDLSMPDMDGLEALPRILEASPRSKVAIYSGFEADRLEAASTELGAGGYIEKGTKPTEMIAKLLGILGTTA